MTPVTSYSLFYTQLILINLFISKAAHEKKKILRFGGPVSTQTTNIMQNHIKENHQGHIRDGQHVKNLA